MSGKPSVLDLSKFTLGDIAFQRKPSASFYLAASQPLVNALTYKGEDGKIHAHDPFFKNMTATIVLETALRDPEASKVTNHKDWLALKLNIFNIMKKPSQLTILNLLWGYCYRQVTPSLLASSMVDGEMGVAGEGSLPSSIRLANNSSFFATIEAGPKPRAWTEFQVGFRIDGGKGKDGQRDDLGRITTEGMVALQKSPDLAVKVVKKYYHGHVSCLSKDLYIGYQNRDLYNESGTCVSRSLLGATAFPYRHSDNTASAGDGADLEYQYLFAVDCKGAKGVDTEKTQLDAAAHSLWRPGEKAFAGIAPSRLIGWTKLVRTGQPRKPSGQLGETGWSFKFPDPKWNWIKAPGGDLQSYLNAELATWVKDVRYVIRDQYDFQQDPG